MGMIFQNTGASLCPIRTIEDQLYESVLQHEKTSKQEIKERAMDLFEKMKLSDGERILKSYPFELSGGMNQRVGIMMAMILGPSLLFADEPTSALDPETTNEVIATIQKLVDQKITMLIVTHDMRFAKSSATRVIFMDEGRIIEENTPEELFNHPENTRLQIFLQSVERS